MVLRQRVQTFTRRFSPFISRLRRETFGFHILRVARIEWLRVFPNCGPLPQTKHFAIVVSLESVFPERSNVWIGHNADQWDFAHPDTLS